MDYGVKTYSVVDWGVVCLLAATVGPIVRYRGLWAATACPGSYATVLGLCLCLCLCPSGE